MAKANKSEPLAQDLARIFAQFRRLTPPKGTFHSIKAGEFFLLTTLIDAIPAGGEGLKASELSNRLQVTPAAVTHLINDLEKAGHVERISDPADRRIVLIKPTRAGLKLMETANAQFLDVLRGLIEFVGEDDSREFVRLMSSVVTYFKGKMAADKEQEE